MEYTKQYIAGTDTLGRGFAAVRPSYSVDLIDTTDIKVLPM